MEVKISPLTLKSEDIETIVHILNRGNQCEIKKEKDNIVIVEIKRFAVIKKPAVEQ